MITNTVPSIPSSGSGQARLSRRKRLIGAFDRFLDSRVEAARQAADRDREQNKGPGTRPSLIFLSE